MQQLLCNKCCLVLVVVVAALSQTALHADVITNGSFEDGLSNWNANTSGNGNGYAGTTTNWNSLAPTDGDAFASLYALACTELPGYGPHEEECNLSQTFFVDADSMLTFDAFSSISMVGMGAGYGYAEALLDGNDIGYVTGSGWNSFSQSVSTGSHTLTFVLHVMAAGGGGGGEGGGVGGATQVYGNMGIDNVQIPEPCTLALLAIGAVGLLVCHARRRRAT